MNFNNIMLNEISKSLVEKYQSYEVFKVVKLTEAQSQVMVVWQKSH